MATTSPSRFGLGATAWIIIVAVLLVVLAAMVIYFRSAPVGDSPALFRRPTMTSQTVTFHIPRSLKAEHDELHAELARATKESGEIGAAARKVARILHPHFVSEEEFALPPLGLLPALAAGAVKPDMKPAIEMTRRLKSELPRMLDEHKAIVAALRKLVDASAKAQRPDVGTFAEKLILHAQTEEEVLYPAAIVLGEWLESKLTIDGH